MALETGEIWSNNFFQKTYKKLLSFPFPSAKSRLYANPAPYFWSSILR